LNKAANDALFAKVAGDQA